MLPELRQIFELNEGHFYILSIDLNIAKEDSDLDSLKDLIFIEILQNTLSVEKVEYVMNRSTVYEFMRAILLKNLKYLKSHDTLIIGLCIENILKQTDI